MTGKKRRSKEPVNSEKSSGKVGKIEVGNCRFECCRAAHQCHAVEQNQHPGNSHYCRSCRAARLTPSTDPVPPRTEPVIPLLKRELAVRSVRVGDGT
jgi:hypothetical protein